MASQPVDIYLGTGKDTLRQAIGIGIEKISGHLKVIMILFCNEQEIHLYETLKPLEPQLRFFHFENTTLMFAKKVMDTEECDVLILANILDAINKKLITVDQLSDIIDNKPDHIQLILTGESLPLEICSKDKHIIYIKE